MSKKDEILLKINKISKWRHCIDLGNGVITPGFIDHGRELQRMALSSLDLRDKEVLDIGCSDGYYSFYAENQGAKRILGIDNMSSKLANGTNGFEICQEILSSKCEFKALSVYNLDNKITGQFDVILFFNVLYHLKYPLYGLERIYDALKPGGTLILKTLYDKDISLSMGKYKIGVDIGLGPHAKFYPNSERAGDPTNWWVGNKKWVCSQLKVAGFQDVEIKFVSHDRVYLHCKKKYN